jgi:hypothetical protein
MRDYKSPIQPHKTKYNNMKICKHFANIEYPKGGFCNLYGKLCTFGECRMCLDNTEAKDWPFANNLLQHLKLGTKIKTVTNTLGIKHCHSCHRRGEKINGDS